MTVPPAAQEAPQAEFARLLSADRMTDLCDRAKALPPGALNPDMLRMLVIAALATGDATARDRAVGAALEMRMPPAVRSVIVSRLVEAGHDAEAHAVVLADPGFHQPPAPARQVVVNAYAALARHAGSPLMRRAAAAAVTRLLNRAPMAATPSPLQLPPAAPTAESEAPQPLRLIPAGPEEEPDASLFRGQEEAFEAALRRPRPDQVVLARDVYVTRTGEIWDAQGRMLRDNRRVLRPECLAAMADAPVFEEAVDALDGTGNFFHWMAETLPSIAFAAAPGAPCLPVLLREDAPAFVAASLDLASPALAARVRRVGEAAFVRRLHIGPRNTANLRFGGAYDHLLGPVIAHVDRLPPAAEDTTDLLYISRRDSPIRPMSNEAELEGALAGLGFRVLLLGALPLAEQVRAVRRARVIVAPHGAGLAHLLFARPGTRVLELLSIRDGVHPLAFCMARLSRLRGHRHAIWIQRGHPTDKAWTARIPEVLAIVREVVG